MKPGDLVNLGRGTSARLYGTPDMVDSGRDNNKPDITAVVFGNEVGLVIAEVGTQAGSVYLFLFGEKLGWRDSYPWRVISETR